MRAGTRGRARLLVVAIEALAALAFVAFLLGKQGVTLPFAGGEFEVEAAFVDAGGLRGHEPVTVAGVPAGRVESVRYAGGAAIARMSLDDFARGALHGDATAAIAPRSALEDLTVDIAPGSASAPALRPGARIAVARTVSSVGPDEVASVLDPDTRAQAAILLDQLAVGLRGNAAPLAAAIASLRPALDSSGRVAGALAKRRLLVARLVADLDHVGVALGAHDRALAGAIEAARRTLAVTAQSRAPLAGSVRRLPATLQALDDALRKVHGLAEPLDPALVALRPGAAALPAALSAAGAATPAFGALVQDVGRLAHAGGRPADSLRDTVARLGPAANDTLPALRDVRPLVAAVDADRAGISQLGERFSGVLSTNDANGPILRGLGSFEPFDPADVGEPGASGARLAALKLESVRALTDVCLTENPLACLARYLIPGLPGAVR